MEYRTLSTSDNNQLDFNFTVFIIIGRHDYKYLIELHSPTLLAICHMLTRFRHLDIGMKQVDGL